MQIEILDQAIDDIEKASLFYQSQEEKLGKYFLDSIFSDIESLKIYYGMHIKIYGFYRLLAKRFPYAIYYLVKDETIRVYAVLDCRSNPIKIQDRLGKEQCSF